MIFHNRQNLVSGKAKSVIGSEPIIDDGYTVTKSSNISVINMSETIARNEKPSKFISTVLFTCSGISNTGKLTEIAATTLSFRRPDLFRAIPAKKGAESLNDAKKDGELIFVVDGCEEHCAKKKLDIAGIEADMQIVLTQIGIKRTNPSDIKSKYVEQAISALSNTVKSLPK